MNRFRLLCRMDRSPFRLQVQPLKRPTRILFNRSLRPAILVGAVADRDRSTGAANIAHAWGQSALAGRKSSCKEARAHLLNMRAQLADDVAEVPDGVVFRHSGKNSLECLEIGVNV